MLNSLLVVDSTLLSVVAHLDVISFESYLSDYPKLNEPKIRIINLCDTSLYLSKGYYCSLLAEARDHQVVPSVKVINELRKEGVTLWLKNSVLGKKFGKDQSEGSTIICMSEVADSQYSRLAAFIFQKFPAPILSVSFAKESEGIRLQVRRVSLPELTENQRDFCLSTLQMYSQKSWRSKADQKKYRWDMAILSDPEELVPPSNKGAISRFVKAGEKLGIRVKPITSKDFSQLGQYDALFIRETTAIDHHTYRFAIEAENLGLIVIDDPNAILRCCNKVFLHDAFSYQKVPSLPTRIFADTSDETLLGIEEAIQYPMVLKMPEGSFSKGVFRVKSRAELVQKASELFKDSALLLAQKFLFTDFDWRIGVLNGRALYACRYYMAKNHWQIYNHESKRFFSGGFDALPTFEAPAQVLKVALKSAAVVGTGLYGVDVKEDRGNAYVIEVNDNPSIDHGVEDAYLGDELYMQIMAEFSRRLELRGK